VTTRPRGEPATPPQHVARELVREHCLDAEDGRDGHVAIQYLRYDTAIRSTVEVDLDAATLAYEYDDGPGTFSGDAHRRFLEWVSGLPRWTPVYATEPEAKPTSPRTADEPVRSWPTLGSPKLAVAGRGGVPDLGWSAVPARAAGVGVEKVRAEGSVTREPPKSRPTPVMGSAISTVEESGGMTASTIADASAAPAAPATATASEIWARPPESR
jgi:hypothetical protein